MTIKNNRSGCDILLYLAYGSNIGKREMRYRCPNAVLIKQGLLNDFSLEFRGGNIGYLTIKQCYGSKIPVSIWRITSEDKTSLDRYEGLGTLYHLEEIKCTIDNNEYKTFAYIMNENFKVARPTKEYLRRCIKMYEDEGFKEYVGILNDAYDKVLLKSNKIKVKDIIKNELSWKVTRNGIVILTNKCIEFLDQKRVDEILKCNVLTTVKDIDFLVIVIE